MSGGEEESGRRSDEEIEEASEKRKQNQKQKQKQKQEEIFLEIVQVLLEADESWRAAEERGSQEIQGVCNAILENAKLAGSVRDGRMLEIARAGLQEKALRKLGKLNSTVAA